MTTLTITIDDATYELIQRRARDSNATPEEVAAALTTAGAQQPAVDGVSEEFKEITAEIIATYRPLFHRLAQ